MPFDPSAYVQPPTNPVEWARLQHETTREINQSIENGVNRRENNRRWEAEFQNQQDQQARRKEEWEAEHALAEKRQGLSERQYGLQEREFALRENQDQYRRQQDDYQKRKDFADAAMKAAEEFAGNPEGFEEWAHGANASGGDYVLVPGKVTPAQMAEQARPGQAPPPQQGPTEPPMDAAPRTPEEHAALQQRILDEGRESRTAGGDLSKLPPGRGKSPEGQRASDAITDAGNRYAERAGGGLGVADDRPIPAESLPPEVAAETLYPGSSAGESTQHRHYREATYDLAIESGKITREQAKELAPDIYGEDPAPTVDELRRNGGEDLIAEMEDWQTNSEIQSKAAAHKNKLVMSQYQMELGHLKQLRGTANMSEAQWLSAADALNQKYGLPPNQWQRPVDPATGQPVPIDPFPPEVQQLLANPINARSSFSDGVEAGGWTIVNRRTGQPVGESIDYVGMMARRENAMIAKLSPIADLLAHDNAEQHKRIMDMVTAYVKTKDPRVFEIIKTALGNETARYNAEMSFGFRDSADKRSEKRFEHTVRVSLDRRVEDISSTIMKNNSVKKWVDALNESNGILQSLQENISIQNNPNATDEQRAKAKANITAQRMAIGRLIKSTFGAPSDDERRFINDRTLIDKVKEIESYIDPSKGGEFTVDKMDDIKQYLAKMGEVNKRRILAAQAEIRDQIVNDPSIRGYADTIGISEEEIYKRADQSAKRAFISPGDVVGGDYKGRRAPSYTDRVSKSVAPVMGGVAEGVVGAIESATGQPPPRTQNKQPKADDDGFAP